MHILRTSSGGGRSFRDYNFSCAGFFICEGPGKDPPRIMHDALNTGRKFQLDFLNISRNRIIIIKNLLSGEGAGGIQLENVIDLNSC